LLIAPMATKSPPLNPESTVTWLLAVETWTSPET
jgi:hypothetical protein